MKLKIILLLIVFCPISNISFGQNTSYQYLDALVTSFVKELQTQNVDTICIYQDYCVGYIYPSKNEDDKCFFSSIYMPTYILWISQAKTFLTKKDNCFDYSIIEIDSITVWKLFFKYKNQIKEEKVKPFEYLAFENNKKEKFFILRDHSCHRDFKTIVNGDTIGLKFDDFNLSKKFDGCTNINYKHNHSLKGKKIVDELRKLVKCIENEQLLTKNRR